MDTCHADATCTDGGLVATCVCNPGYTGDATTACDGKYNPHMLDSKVQTNVQILMSVLRAPVTLMPFVLTWSTASPAHAIQAIREMEQCAQVSTTHTCWTPIQTQSTQCADIDDCDPSPCHADAFCTDMVDSFTCTCNPGYTGDGTMCTGKYNPHMLDSNSNSIHPMCRY